METTIEKRNSIVDCRELLLVSLAKYYSNKGYILQVAPIIEGKSKLSLRLIDWFVTNYSKKNGTIITKEVDNNVIHFNVYLSYRSQLKAYSKQQFDPFRRRDRIMFHHDIDCQPIETTIGQLNFFRWILQNNILSYIDENYDKIDEDMVKSQKENQQKRDDNLKVKIVTNQQGETIVQKRKKRNELSKSFVHNMNQFQGKTTILFD